MQVSVIIPVYNAGRFVRTAVESALSQPETAEVLLIEDSSPDHSLAVCEALVSECPTIKLLQHPDGKNHGAAASRNLGIRSARQDYVAFLDADDFFLPNRFKHASQILGNDHSLDGVYEAVGVHFEDSRAERVWHRERSGVLTTVSGAIPPERLFFEMSPMGNAGRAHTNGWVIKRSLFKITGLFDEHLRLHQDTAMFIKFTALGRFVPGCLTHPVAMRRVHSDNRIFASRSDKARHKNVVLMWYTVWRWSQNNLALQKQELLFEKLLMHAARPYQHQNSRYLGRRLQTMRQLVELLGRYPELALYSAYWLKLASSTGVSSLLPQTWANR